MRRGNALPRGGAADPREALATIVDNSRETYAALSRMIGRPPGYLRRFVVAGIPTALRREEHANLAEFFGVTERDLDIRDLWLHRA